MLSIVQSEELKRSSIFIVDDQLTNLKLMEIILREEGFTNLTLIQNPADVLKHFKNNPPAIMLLDFNMPGMNGFEVIEQLNNNLPNSLPPIVFITAETSNNIRARAFEQGVLDFINKPFQKVELLSRVKNLLALENAHRKLELKNNNLEEMVEIRTHELRKTQRDIVQKLGRAAEFRDNETGAHIIRMSNISALLAGQLGFSAEEVENVLFASPMHDIGKIAIPDHILLKPGKFSPDEWSIMKTHTTIGATILSGNNSKLLTLASEIALSHHEKWDGSGYPHGLAGNGIPLSCRIVAIADAFDALLSDRPYKKAWCLDDALDYINEKSGEHFDPKVVSTFNSHLPQILEIRKRYRDPEQREQQKIIEESLPWMLSSTPFDTSF